jgi:hypothetical protein
MACTVDEIRVWLEEGRKQGATHTLICRDSFDNSNYPVHVKKGQDVELVVRGERSQNMTEVIEAYCLGLDLEEQLQEHRAWHTEYPPDPPERRHRLSPLAV